MQVVDRAMHGPAVVADQLGAVIERASQRRDVAVESVLDRSVGRRSRDSRAERSQAGHLRSERVANPAVGWRALVQQLVAEDQHRGRRLGA